MCACVHVLMHAYLVVVVPDTGGTRCMVECPHSVWDYNYFVVCCHPDPLLHLPDTTTPLLARYLLIKIWLQGNRLQMRACICVCNHASTAPSVWDYNYYVCVCVCLPSITKQRGV